MKKLILLFLAIAFASATIAQDASTRADAKPPTDQKQTKTNFVIMQDGKVWLMKEERQILISNDVSIGGTTVMYDGSVTLKNKTRTGLKEGDRVNAEGIVIRATENKMKETDKTDQK